MYFVLRCRQENTYPYFLNLMSERYGWAPKIEEVPEDIRARYDKTKYHILCCVSFVLSIQSNLSMQAPLLSSHPVLKGHLILFCHRKCHMK